MFAFALYDNRDPGDGRILLARDTAGVKPLYVGRGHDKSFFAASEAKALVGLVTSADLLAPGHLHDGSQSVAFHVSQETMHYHSFGEAAARLCELVNEAVALRIPDDLPFAVFLSHCRLLI